MGALCRKIRVGFDIGGVLSKYPEVFKPMIEALNAHPAFEVHVLTDVPAPRSIELVHKNGYQVPAERIHTANYPLHGSNCKARKVEELGLALLIDDHLPYLENVKAMRLHVMPDSSKPFFHPDIDECR